MITRHSDIDKDQEATPVAPGSLYTESILQPEKVSPMGNFPQPPRRPPRSKRKYWYGVASVIIAVALILSVFALVLALQGQHPSTQVAPTPTAPGTKITPTPGEQTPTPGPGVVLGPQVCPTGVADPVFWNCVLHTPGTDGQVESISCANVLGNPTLQALVTVRHRGANSTLDGYVFDKITSANPTQLFKLTGLIKGDAKISFYNSILTAEVDQNSTLNAGKPVAQWTADLFREFTWNGEALSQVAFPGLFPDLTRYQAETDQASVNAGHDPWKNDAVQVAKALEARFFGWQRLVMAKLLSGGGSQDVSASVQVQEASVQGARPSIVVTLSRLEGNSHNMWVVTGVTDGTNLTLTNIQARQLLTSPVTLEGTGSAFEAVIGQAVVYDHLSTAIGHAQIIGSNGMGVGNYSTLVSYISSYTGVQEGFVTVYQNNGGLSAENVSAVMVKVLLSPVQQSLTVLSVNLTVSPSSIAGTICGAPMTLTYTATFHVQAGQTGGTIWFLYTWNNGRASPTGTVTVPPNGPNTVTFTYMATGRVGGAYAFPGVAQVNVISPNVVQSNQAIPTGACTVPSPGLTPTINALWMSDATTGWARTTTAPDLAHHRWWQELAGCDATVSLLAVMGQFPPTFASLGGNTAWVAVSEKLPDGTTASVVFRTSDGGQSWQQTTLPTGQLGVNQVQFVNAQDGWILASPGGGAAGSEGVNLFRTTDGGQTWSLVASAPGSLPLHGIKSGMGWISATTGWITGSIAIPNFVYLYRTQDGGVSWQQQSLPSPFPIQATQPPMFFSASEGLLPVTFSTPQGPSFAIYATHDGGATWSSSTPLSMMTGTWDFLTMQQGWVVGANGSSLNETSDGGQHWTAIAPSANFQHISQLDFVSAPEGWAISTPPPAAPVLLKTMDGGQTWVQVSPGLQVASWQVVSSPNVGTNFNYLNGVATVSATDIWAVGYSSKQWYHQPDADRTLEW